MRRLASTPASYQLLPVVPTHVRQVAQWISASAWNRGPSARNRHAWFGRGLVLSETSGGIEM